MPSSIKAFANRLLHDKNVRFFILKVALGSFIVVFSISLPFFFLKETPWMAFLKTVNLSLFALSVGMFSAMLGEILKGKE